MKMEINVRNIKGEDTGSKVTLDASVFGVTPSEHAIYLDVKQYLAAQRQGTHKSKQRNEIKGSTRKIKRQKGTGGARFGSIKSPIFRGGGRVFGPVPRDYDFKLNKKLKQLARRSALSLKAQSLAITVVDSLQLDDARTKLFFEAAKNLGLEGKKLLIVGVNSERTMLLAARNVQKMKVVNAASLNTYDIMNCAVMLCTAEAVEAINAQLSK